jgi:hypothetical protein
MADSAQSSITGTGTGSGFTVSADVAQKFPDLIALIKQSESMNDEERQYWINILPVMTPEQLQNLRDILNNEKKQLAAIDAKYQTDIQKIGQADTVKQTEEERRKKRMERQSQEQSHKSTEEQATEDILKKIENESL